MNNKEWFLGLDIGSASVGWAATDTSYKIIRKNNKRLWGVRLFDEATTAVERRGFRSARRRLARKKWRLHLLDELFAEEINKVDPNFFMRLRESKYYLEDKSVDTKYVLFNDKDYNDKDYYKEYPTIYHLRKALMNEESPDIRKVYLAVHHIIKNRGHFLLQGQNFSDSNIDNVIRELLELKVVDFEGDDETIKIIKDIALDKRGLKEKNTELKKLYPKEKQLQEIFKLIFGGKADLDKLFNEEAYKELDNSVKKISFKDSLYEDVRGEYEQILVNDIELLDLAKLVFDSIILADVKKEGKTISESKVDLYDKHKDDLKTLKNLVNYDTKLSDKGKRETYFLIFKEDKSNGSNYVNYVRKSEEGGRCNYEDFSKFLKKQLEKLADSKEKSRVLEELDLEKFLPLQRTKDNSVVPYQIHKEELIKILENAAKYYPFLLEKDDSGYSVLEKIVLILEFRVPYFVGPLNTTHRVEDGGFAWAVRNAGQEGIAVTPWNYSKVIDESASAEEFINNLTNNCTYLIGEDVLPKNSLLYSEYALLNELNALRCDGERLDVRARDVIVEKLFKQKSGSVSKKTIKNLLKSEGLIDGRGEITGIDITVKNDLKSYRDFKAILGDKFDNVRVENIIRWITLYGDGGGQKLTKNKITSVYGDYYTKDEITKMSRLSYKDWGTLSEKFLIGIVSNKHYDKDTGELLNIINAMRVDTILLMELLANKYDYMDKVKAFNKEHQKEITEITHALLDDLYVSPSVKRAIWQTIKIVEELKKIIGSEPKKIFVETTKTNRAEKGDKGRKDARQKRVIDLYKNIKDKDLAMLEKEINSTIDLSVLKNKLEAEEPSRLKAKKLFLYYMQLGRCLYSGEKIELSELFDNNKYDIDHIYPQSKLKDDSFTNTVLVKREMNAKKSNGMIPLSYQTPANKRFWRFLKDKDLMNEEKYNRLVRTSDFSDDELGGFIARQLVETSQAVKAVANVLGELNPKSVICYSKAENVSEFRRDFGKIKDGDKKSTNNEQLVKVREINDLHHAKDAYLNIVVGNVYDVRFTRNAYNFIKEKNDNRKYSLNNLFYEDVKNKNEVAWVKGETIKTVEKMMNNNNVLVTRRTAEKKGALYDATIYKAKKAKEGSYYPLKTTDKYIKDVSRYGGFTKIKIAYYSIFEYILVNKKGEQKIIKILPIPIFISQNIKNDNALVAYATTQFTCKDNEEIKNIKLRYRKLNEGSLVKRNGYKYNTGGKMNDYIYMDSAVQVLLDKESEKYIKELSNFINWEKDNKEGEVWDSITSEKNKTLYDTLVEKMNTGIFKIKYPNKYSELTKDEIREKFEELSVEEQVRALLEVLNLLTNKKQPGKDIKLLIPASRGTQSFNLSDLSQFSIIEQSVTGFYEKEITIIGDKNNDMENSSN